MPAPDFSALLKWPDVPAVYGWLRLDRRGQWRLRDAPVRHGGLEAFFNRQYAADDAGNWFVQNGPQRVFVALDYTPWVFRADASANPVAHTGEARGRVREVLVDEDGSLLLATGLGIGVVDDRDVPALLGACRHEGGSTGLDAVETWLSAGGELLWRDIPVQRVLRAAVAARYGFNPAPAPDGRAPARS